MTLNIIYINIFILFCLSLFGLISNIQSLFDENENQNQVIVLLSIILLLLLIHLASYILFVEIVYLVGYEILQIIHWIIILSESAISLIVIIIFYKN